MSTRLSYHQKKQNKNRTTIAGIFSGHSRFVKSKKSEVSTSATAEPTRPASRTTSRPVSRTTSRQASRTTSRQASLQPRQESPQPQPSSLHVIINRHPSPSPSQTTSRKRRKTKTGVTEIGDDNDDAPLTRKEAKIFFNKLKKEISDVRKLLEISGVGDYTTEESFIKEFVREITSYFINKYIYPNKKELKKSAGAISAKSYPEYFEHWEDDRWSYYYSKYIHSRLLAKHWSRRGTIATKVQSSFFLTFGKSDLPTINTKSAASEVLSWKKSQKVKDVLRKLNQNIDGHKNLTWYTKIMEKIWEKSKKVPKEKVAFTISIIQYLLSPKVESIKIDDEAIRKRMKKNIKKLEKGETIEFEEKSDEESELEEESEEESSKEEEKKSKEREEREEEEERRWEGEERRFGEERILEEERGREERQEGEERREEEERREIWNEELIEIISGGPNFSPSEAPPLSTDPKLITLRKPYLVGQGGSEKTTRAIRAFPNRKIVVLTPANLLAEMSNLCIFEPSIGFRFLFIRPVQLTPWGDKEGPHKFLTEWADEVIWCMEDYRAQNDELKALKLRMWMENDIAQLLEFRKAIPKTSWENALTQWTPNDIWICSTNDIVQLYQSHRFHRLQLEVDGTDETDEPVQIPGSIEIIEAYVGTIVNVPLEIVLRGLPAEWKYAGWGTAPERCFIVDHSLRGWINNAVYTACTTPCPQIIKAKLRHYKLDDRKKNRHFPRPLMIVEDWKVDNKSDLMEDSTVCEKPLFLAENDEENAIPSLTVKDIIEIATRQDKCCKVCRVPLLFQGYSNHHPQLFSVDRFDDAEGHYRQNVRITCLHCNERHRRKFPVKALIDTTSKYNTISRRLFDKLEEDYGIRHICDPVEILYGDVIARSHHAKIVIDGISIPLIDKDFNINSSTKNNSSNSAKSKDEITNMINKILSDAKNNKHRKRHHKISRNIPPTPPRRLDDDVPKNSEASKNKKYPKVDLSDRCGKLSIKTHLNNIWKSVHFIEDDIYYGIFKRLSNIENELRFEKIEELVRLNNNESGPSNSHSRQNKSKKCGVKYSTDSNTDTSDTSTSYSPNSGPEGVYKVTVVKKAKIPQEIN
ncbi:hypothetical protein Glove_16g107 [Diversispora epigaea]|uniref:Uncharacterized protein n=1 Tax=Diversispora epigaea TaxID=1348612 RepID=A0A397JPQ3_9GLOM|nr:hypothetical protein Glove_16g107 [Diversispora epigaea]